MTTPASTKGPEATTRILDTSGPSFTDRAKKDERQKQAEDDLVRQGKEVTNAYVEEFDRLSRENAFARNRDSGRRPFQYREGPPSIDALRILANLHDLGETVVIHSDNGRWLGAFAELMEDRRREHEKDLRQQQDGRSVGEIRSAAEAMASEELARHLIVTPEMAADPRRADRFWRNSDGTWRWRGDDEIGPPEPEPVKGCPCGGEVIRDPYSGWTCRSCNTALLESQLVEMGEPQSRPRVRVSRQSPDELRQRGLIV